MTNRAGLPVAVCALLLLLCGCAHAQTLGAPNIVLLVTDDQGYGDLSVTGHPTIRTPNIDRLANEGTRFTQFLAGNQVCTPSRAALLTGRLPVRSGMTGTIRGNVYSPALPTGLPHDETTIAEALKAAGTPYATAMVGKWHLGINRENNTDGWYLPTSHGFDSWYGTPMSNGNYCGTATENKPESWEKCFMMRDANVVQQPVVINTIPNRLQDEAFRFLRDNAGVRPFFLYYAFLQPHRPLFASPERVGVSRRGAYGDAVEDVDYAIGQLVDLLGELGQLDNTLIVYTSDNGGWLEVEEEGGSNGPLRGGKGQDYEGGVRVPGIVWGPGLGVQAQVSQAIVSAFDVLPTILDYAGVAFPPPSATNLTFDGRSVRPILEGAEDDAVTADSRVIFHYCGYNLRAMRYGPWKAHFKTPRITNEVENTCTEFAGESINACMCLDVANYQHDPPLLYNLDVDLKERLAIDTATNPEAAAALAYILQARAAHEAELVPGATQVDRLPVPELQPCCNPPTCRCEEF